MVVAVVVLKMGTICGLWRKLLTCLVVLRVSLADYHALSGKLWDEQSIYALVQARAWAGKSAEQFSMFAPNDNSLFLGYACQRAELAN